MARPPGSGEPPADSEERDPWDYDSAAADGPDYDDEEYQEPDRSGLSASDLEPKAPTALGKRLRFLTGWQLVLIVFVILLVVPLILAVALNPLIAFLSRG
jgi:hypothetical protein